MVPSAIVALQRLPLNANGKLDRKALPDPAVLEADRYEAPHGEIEQSLAAIWSGALGVQRIGRHDNFFELGGHSLAAMKVVAQVKHQLLLTMQLRDLFEAPTLAQLVKRKVFADRHASPDNILKIDRLLAMVEEQQ
jgi:acyl carrier protein